MSRFGKWNGYDAVAIIIALGVCIVVTLFVLAAVIDSLNKDTALSDNATQVLTGAIGGMIGVLGGYVGGRAVQRQRDADHAEPTPFDDAHGE